MDDAGRRYLDGSASLWHTHVGHGGAEIADAVARQLRTLEAYQTFGDLANPPALELSERLAGLATMADPRVFLTSGGGDGIETAAKIARAHWAARATGAHPSHQPRARVSRHPWIRDGPDGDGDRAPGFGPLAAGVSQVASTRWRRSRRRSCGWAPSAWRRSSASR